MLQSGIERFVSKEGDFLPMNPPILMDFTNVVNESEQLLALRPELN